MISTQVCGRAEGGDYVKCAGRRCHGFVHRRCVGLTADEGVPEGWLCPLCDTRGVASKLSVHGGPLAKSSPLIGRVLLVPPGAEVLAAASDGSDDDAGRAPLLLRAVGARTLPEAVTADATKPPPSGSRVAVTFDCGEEYEGTVDDVLDDKSAMIDFDDGQSEKVNFTEGGVRVISGSDVVVRCVALVGDDEETWEISEAAARHAALRREREAAAAAGLLPSDVGPRCSMRSTSTSPACLLKTWRSGAPVARLPIEIAPA